MRNTRGGKDETFHTSERISNFEFASFTVNPDLELHSLELSLPPVAVSAQQAGEVVQCSFHGNE